MGRCGIYRLVLCQITGELLKPAKTEGASGQGSGDTEVSKTVSSPVVSSTSGEGDQQSSLSKSDKSEDSEAAPAKRQKTE